MKTYPCRCACGCVQESELPKERQSKRDPRYSEYIALHHRCSNCVNKVHKHIKPEALTASRVECEHGYDVCPICDVIRL